MNRLAIVSTHPIQYNAPFFRALATISNLETLVFFTKTWEQVRYDPDFQREVKWDTPVDKGYAHTTLDASSYSGRKSLIQGIRTFAPHAILIYGWNFPGHLQVMRRFFSTIPIWFRGDSHLLDPLNPVKKYIRRITLKWVYRHIDLAFTVGTANEAYFRWCGLHDTRLIRAPHAIDQDFFQRQSEKHTEDAIRWRSSLGITKNDKVILFAGKLEKKKQPLELLQAWEKLPNPKPHILIVGSGPLESLLHSRWRNSMNVHFLGFQNQSTMPIVYRMADLVCLPSMGPSETWGLTINEAMACEVPCLVSDRVGCSLDMFDNPAHGAVVPADQPMLWNNAIVNLIRKNENHTDWASIHEEFHMKHFIREITLQFDNINQ